MSSGASVSEGVGWRSEEFPEGRDVRYRRFGTTDLQISELGFGAMRLGGDAAHVPRPTPLSATEAQQQTASGRRALLAALDGGVNCIHSSQDYGTWGLLGEILADHPKRDELHHVIKVMSPDYDEVDFDPSTVRRSVEEALRALHAERISFVQHLQRGPRVSPEDAYSTAGDGRRIGALPSIADDFGAIISTLQDEGKVGHAVTFPHTVPYARAALQTGVYAGVAHFFNLLEAEALDLLDEAEEQGFGYFAIRPLLQGLLTDKRINRADLPPGDIMEHPAWDARYELLGQVREVVGDPEVSWTDFALRFALAHPAVTSLIVSANSEDQVQTLLAAADGTSPSMQLIREVAHLGAASPWMAKTDLFPQHLESRAES